MFAFDYILLNNNCNEEDLKKLYFLLYLRHFYFFGDIYEKVNVVTMYSPSTHCTKDEFFH